MEFGGSPGAASATPSGVIVNEVLSHTDSPRKDSIELLNTSAVAVDIGGWYLSDSGNQLKKFQIPLGTILGPNTYIVFDEGDFNPNPSSPGPNNFSLNGAEGDDVYLVAATSGVVRGIEDSVSFGAAFNGESYGRSPNGTGRLMPNAAATPVAPNSVTRQANVLISEVAYHPTAPSPAAKAVLAGLTDSDLEFVEIYNAGLTPVNLTNWRLRGEADFDFAPAAMLGVGQALVIVSFDTADPTLELAFRTHYGIGAGVPLVGGFSGGLSNNYGRLTLQRPDEPPTNDPGLIPQVIEDEVLYDDRGAWSPSADGGAPR